MPESAAESSSESISALLPLPLISPNREVRGEPEELEVSWPPAATEAKLLMQLVYASSMPISSYISTMLFMEESFR